MFPGSGTESIPRTPRDFGQRQLSRFFGFFILALFSQKAFLNFNNMPRTPTIKEFLIGPWPSDLPPAMEAKRRAIAKKHNRAVGLLILCCYGPLFAAACAISTFPWHAMRNFALIVLLCGFILFLVAGLWWIPRYDHELCIRYDFFCPHCKHHLYHDPKTTHRDLLNGICPKCKGHLHTEEEGQTKPSHRTSS